MTDFFKDIPEIKFEGPEGENEFAFCHYDPAETVNLAGKPEHASALAELKRQLRDHLLTLPGTFAELKTLDVMTVPVEVDVQTPGIVVFHDCPSFIDEGLELIPGALGFRIPLGCFYDLPVWIEFDAVEPGDDDVGITAGEVEDRLPDLSSQLLGVPVLDGDAIVAGDLAQRRSSLQVEEVKPTTLRS